MAQRYLFVAGGCTPTTIMIRVRVAGACDAPAVRSGTGASHAARCFSLFERQLRVQSNRLLLPVGAKNVASIIPSVVVIKLKILGTKKPLEEVKLYG